jgi:hypothetical protein
MHTPEANPPANSTEAESRLTGISTVSPEQPEASFLADGSSLNAIRARGSRGRRTQQLLDAVFYWTLSRS